MVIDVTRGFIKVEIKGKTVRVPGEMFFPPNGKMGFAVFSNEIEFWEHPNEGTRLTAEEVEEVLGDIRADFSKGGHVLEVE